MNYEKYLGKLAKADPIQNEKWVKCDWSDSIFASDMGRVGIKGQDGEMSLAKCDAFSNKMGKRYVRCYIPKRECNIKYPDKGGNFITITRSRIIARAFLDNDLPLWHSKGDKDLIPIHVNSDDPSDDSVSNLRIGTRNQAHDTSDPDLKGRRCRKAAKCYAYRNGVTVEFRSSLEMNRFLADSNNMGFFGSAKKRQSHIMLGYLIWDDTMEKPDTSAEEVNHALYGKPRESTRKKKSDPKRKSTHVNQKHEYQVKSHSQLYYCWKDMRRRCSPNALKKDIKYYYEKGIRVCDEWENDFDAFAEWAIKNGYHKKDASKPRSEMLTLDRIDSDKGYFPENCRWIPLKENIKHATSGKHGGKFIMDIDSGIAYKSARDAYRKIGGDYYSIARAANPNSPRAFDSKLHHRWKYISEDEYSKANKAE